MKTTFNYKLLYFLIILLNCSTAKNNKSEKDSQTEKESRDKIYYNDKVYYKIEYDKNGKLKKAYSYKIVDGYPVYHGTFVSYYSNGNIFRTTYYKNGVQHGNDITFSREGFLSMNVNYKKGVYHGSYKTYCYLSKNIPQKDGIFQEGKKIGMWTEYGCNDKISASGEYMDSMIVIKHDIINSNMMYIENVYGDTIDSLRYSKENYNRISLRPKSEYDGLIYSPTRVYFKTGKWIYRKAGIIIREEYYEKGKLVKVDDWE